MITIFFFYSETTSKVTAKHNYLSNVFQPTRFDYNNSGPIQWQQLYKGHICSNADVEEIFLYLIITLQLNDNNK